MMIEPVKGYQETDVIPTEPRACHQALAAIATALQTGTLENLDAQIYAHVSTCRRCRAGLLVMLAGLGQAALPPHIRTSCARCQEDLAAFIDLEGSDPAQAAALFPHVWWHLWTCAECAQTYAFTRALLDAERAGELLPLHLLLDRAQRATRAVREVRLHRAMLAFILPVLGMERMVLRGDEEAEYILYDHIEDEPDPYQFTISVHEQSDGYWRMMVKLLPVVEGVLVLTAGTTRRVAPIDAAGEAVLDKLPAELVIAPDAPDLEVSVIPPDAG